MNRRCISVAACAVLMIWQARSSSATDLSADNLTVTTNITQTSSAGKATFMGKVGIKDSNPAQALSVVGDTKLGDDLSTPLAAKLVIVRQGHSDYQPYLGLDNSGYYGWRMGIDNGNTLYFGDPAPKFTFTYLARFGMGTNQPASELHVVGSARITGGSLAINASNPQRTLEVSGTARIGDDYADDGSTAGRLSLVRTGHTNMQSYLSFENHGLTTWRMGMNNVDFWLGSPQYDSQLFTFTQSSQLGIGTNHPAANLHVKGTCIIDGQATLSYVVRQGDISMGPFTSQP